MMHLRSATTAVLLGGLCVASVPATAQDASVFTYYGEVRSTDGAILSEHGYVVSLQTQLLGQQITSALGQSEPGKFAITIVDHASNRAATSGDVVVLTVRDSLGWEGSAPRVVSLSPTNIAQARLRIDLVAADGLHADAATGVWAAGDISGDGISDLVVGSWMEATSLLGRAQLYLGSSSGPVATPSWVQRGSVASDRFGHVAIAAGDVDADGSTDVLVSAPGRSVGMDRAGALLLFRSGDLVAPLRPTWSFSGDQSKAFLGRSAAPAGDVNGDGYDDVLVGAEFYDTTLQDAGKVWLFLGGESGLSTPAWESTGDQSRAFFGASVAPAGDVNGDGFDDIVIGAPGYNGARRDEGRIYVYLGSALGPSAIPTWTYDGGQIGSLFGCSVMTAGDVNGDGYADVIAGACAFDGSNIDAGRALLFLGASDGQLQGPVWIHDGGQTSAFLGRSVGAAGDYNGDGFGDVVVGAPGYDTAFVDVGRAFLFLGSRNGLEPVPHRIWEGTEASEGLGRVVAAVGDVNGDGFGDVALSGIDDSAAAQTGTRLKIQYGAAEPPSPNAAWSRESDLAGDRLGEALAFAGDVNGDGFSDFVVGAPGWDNATTDAGQVTLYRGGATGIETFPSWTVVGEQSGAEFGAAVAPAGDIDGDGYHDLLVGQRSWTGISAGQGRVLVFRGSALGPSTIHDWALEGGSGGDSLGSSLASAGDVDGDGFGDVVVGAPGVSNGLQQEGAVRLYRGSSSGLQPVAAWTAEGESEGARFGAAVASAGDVDGDGFSDVLVGAPQYEGRGRVYLYRGSASGLRQEASWIGLGQEEGALFGAAVASAGDLNADGYADVAIGSPLHDGSDTDTGAVFIYMGSVDGLPASPSIVLAGEGAGCRFGQSVMTAGDVNGDGFSDLVVGSERFSQERGRVAIHLGGSAGVSAQPAWSIDGLQIGDRLGAALGAVGDANGDGYADIAVGMPGWSGSAGRAQVYFGNGRDTSRGWMTRAIHQKRSSGEPLPQLGRLAPDNHFTLSTVAGSPAGRAQLRLQWSLAAGNTRLDHTGVVSGPWNGTAQSVAGNTVSLEQSVPVVFQNWPHHWRARIATQSPFFPYGPWFTVAGTVPSLQHFRSYSAVTDITPDGWQPEGEAVRVGSIWPNPFQLETSIAFAVDSPGWVQVDVFDVLGRAVTRLVNGRRTTGRYVQVWDGRDSLGRSVAAGTYFVRVRVATRERVLKIVRASGP